MTNFQTEFVNIGGSVQQAKPEPMALSIYPPPSDLLKSEQAVWSEALQDFPAQLFKKRNLYLLRIYCKTRVAFEELDFDPFDKEFKRALRQVTVLENMLGLSIRAEQARYDRRQRLARAAADQIAKREAKKAEQKQRPSVTTRDSFNFGQAA